MFTCCITDCQVTLKQYVKPKFALLLNDSNKLAVQNLFEHLGLNSASKAI